MPSGCYEASLGRSVFAQTGTQFWPLTFFVKERSGIMGLHRVGVGWPFLRENYQRADSFAQKSVPLSAEIRGTHPNR